MEAMEFAGSADEITSDYDDSIGISEFTSIKTSGPMNLYEHGRRYQAIIKNRYGLPNDDDEQLREGIKHRMYVDYILHGKLFCSPIGNHPQKIVDLGTGVGFWALDVAEAYPSARVIGTDISAIQPTSVPPNLEFCVEDLEDEFRPWTNIYADADLIHLRALIQTLRHPRQLIENIFDNLKPGGWLECHDTLPQAYLEDGTVDEHHPLNALYRLVDGPFAKVYGWQIRFPFEMPQILRDVGFINIKQQKYPIPIGRWHTESKMREFGMFHQAVTTEFVVAMMAKHELMGLDKDEANTFGQSILDAFDNPNIHAVVNWGAICAQKPLDF